MASTVSSSRPGSANGAGDAEGAVPLGKHLASTEKKVRDRAIRSLAAFLSQAPSRNDGGDEDADSLDEAILPPKEIAKLWKGIFYCFWMSDKPLVQQSLAQDLADLLLKISASPSEKIDEQHRGSLSRGGKAKEKATASARAQKIRLRRAFGFLEGFWDALVREWNGIDRLRIDKYYMLVRRFVNASFRLLAQEGWDEEGLREYERIMTKTGGPLCVNDPRVPASIGYHLADIYLDELEKALGAMEGVPTGEHQTLSQVPLLPLLAPFYSLLAAVQSSTSFDRVLENAIKPAIQACDAAEKALGKMSRTGEEGDVKEKSDRRRGDRKEGGREKKRRRVADSRSDGTAEEAEADGDGEDVEGGTAETDVDRRMKLAIASTRFPRILTFSSTSAHVESTSSDHSEPTTRPARLKDALTRELFRKSEEEETRQPNKKKMHATWKRVGGARPEDKDDGGGSSVVL